MTEHNILLETGTNEVEFLEFYLGHQSFGINVAKIRQIVKFDFASVTKLPNTYPSVLGTVLYHGQAIPLIDLNLHLKRKPFTEPHIPIALVCEFNGALNGFLTNGVNRIHRISWENLHPVPHTLSQYTSRIVGTTTIDERELLVLDFEGIIFDINPESRKFVQNESQKLSIEDKKSRRNASKIMLADDSVTFKEGVRENLRIAEYKDITLFSNGLDLFNTVHALKIKAVHEHNHITDYVSVIITDIEMPKMDGITLCRKVKEDIPEIPVIILSSMFDEQMIQKSQSVYADAHIAKNNFAGLLEAVDRFCLKN
ncbi:MAG: chemotaxis protein CheV [SAR324 cluster bacterium]|nr:chemotaxis protein CheV [SAR324 cluster bacterium]